MNDSMNLKDCIINLLQEKNASEIKVFRTEGAISDYVILANGTSSRNVISIADHLSLSLKQSCNTPIKIEGANLGEWIVLDIYGIFCHIFKPEIRSYYSLDQVYEQKEVSVHEC